MRSTRKLVASPQRDINLHKQRYRCMSVIALALQSLDVLLVLCGSCLFSREFGMCGEDEDMLVFAWH
jgi:hypothetical protein